MTTLSVFSLLVRQTASEFYTAALELAELVGLPVTTWRTGDPTRTMMRADANAFETLDGVQAELAASAFLETATGDWLKLRAIDVYGVEAEEAVAATSTVTLANAGGGLYELAPGGLIVKNSTTGATYANQATVTVNPLAASTGVSVIAQEAGTSGSSGVDDIDTIVSPALTGVTITASTAALGSDAQTDAGLREQCLATLGSLSPNGPADAYEYVARNPDLTGIQGVARAQSDGDTTDGTVTVYVATETAALDGPSVAAIQAACDTWAQPLCTDATVVSGTPQTQAITYALTPDNPEAQVAIEAAVEEYYATIDFGGVILVDSLVSLAKVVCGHGTKVVVTIPAADVDLAAGVFPVPGAVTLT